MFCFTPNHLQGKLLVANYIASVLVPKERSIEMHKLLLIVGILSKKCVLKDMKDTVIDTI
jgi:hypothetical protein